MDRESFEELVARALAELPQEFRDRLDNVDIVVEDWPSRGHLRRAGLRGGFTLMGLYEGVPLTERGQGYNLVPPDRITIFQGPIEAQCRFPEEIVKQVRGVVRHEIAHHFGMGEADLQEIEGEKPEG
jgi:predicted Zn-dependent protease with MMP-like domain